METKVHFVARAGKQNRPPVFCKAYKTYKEAIKKLAKEAELDDEEKKVLTMNQIIFLPSLLVKKHRSFHKHDYAEIKLCECSEPQGHTPQREIELRNERIEKIRERKVHFIAMTLTLDSPVNYDVYETLEEALEAIKEWATISPEEERELKVKGIVTLSDDVLPPDSVAKIQRCKCSEPEKHSEDELDRNFE